MYNTIFRARGIDCASLALWLASGALLTHLIATRSEGAFAVGAVIACIAGASTWVTGVIRRVEERVSDQMTIEHRAQTHTEPPIRLSQVR